MGQAGSLDFNITPDVFRRMAGWFMQHCVQHAHNGGFITRNLSNVIAHLASVPNPDD